jgi:hypothetical protein
LTRPPPRVLLPLAMTALLDLVRKLIDFGKELAATLNQRIVDQPYFAVFNYGTTDLALVLARINRGLLRAIALEERIARLAARPERKPAPTGSPSQRKPRAARPTVQPAQPADALTHLPTPEQIAAEVRRRPIGAVIVDICRDLAILPCHPLWRQIQKAINEHGGSYVRLLKHVINRNYALAVEIVTAPEPVGTGPP